MTKEDIIKMAREAGILVPGYRDHIEHMERFAALVATAEREACAQVCEENADDDSEGEWDSACINCAYHIRARGNT